MSDTIEPMAIDQAQLAHELVEQARAEGVDLVGPRIIKKKMTKAVLETALEAELSAHLGYDKHDPAGRTGGNSRNGTRTKTVLTGIGPVEIEVPPRPGRVVRAGHREEAPATSCQYRSDRFIAGGRGFDDR